MSSQHPPRLHLPATIVPANVTTGGNVPDPSWTRTQSPQPDPWRLVRDVAALFGGDPEAAIGQARRQQMDPMELAHRYARTINVRLTHPEATIFPAESLPAIPPGWLDLRILDQGTVWIDILREGHQILDPDDLTDEHLLNVLRYLRHNAIRFHADYRAAFPDRHIDPDPETWMIGTPLVQALAAERDRRAR